MDHCIYDMVNDKLSTYSDINILNFFNIF